MAAATASSENSTSLAPGVPGGGLHCAETGMVQTPTIAISGMISLRMISPAPMPMLPDITQNASSGDRHGNAHRFLVRPGASSRQFSAPQTFGGACRR